MSYQVNLQFTADTQQAKQQLQNLQQQLTSLVNTPVNIGEKMTAEMQEATQAAAELKIHLQNATNVKTGSLDFGKLNTSIKQSGMSISEYATKLQSLGPRGQQAFMALANSVASAEVPLRRSSAALSGMLTSLKNTMKWQMSSSLMHGLISGVQKAYGYAQDLNESLNNIRIVTGQNIDQMSKFAEQANKAAKALSTTTTEYTNASLIYYQQGLDDAQVKERTDATIKMANVSRQSAEVVSDQMTAIWNNFDNGSKSLEYYADVVTALGAATASSSSEIATGLEKFASVAETVGLSYEYATAALATVTATTRQSADVVGTAFKTLFARLNDLKLGETLDDGTTLGQYTENLAKVGVNIKDASGQLKDMDVILEETAAKWQNLDRDQQTALAKGVAGIRQYNQFIALMDNWDFMEKNLATAENSSGTLQKQADIYAESWEAARKRVTASSEQMYSALLDDEFFIDITNNFADLIDSVGKFIKSIGGLQGVLSTLGAIATKVFEKQIAQGLRNMAYNLKMSTETGRAMVRDERHVETSKMAESMASSETSGDAQLAAKEVYTHQLQAQSEYIMNAEHMTEFEREKYQILMEQYKAFGQQTIEIARQVELLKERKAKASIDIMGSGMQAGATLKEMTEHLQRARDLGEDMGTIEIVFDDINRTGKVATDSIDRLKQAIKNAGGTETDIKSLDNAFAQLEANGKDASVSMEQIKAVMQKIQGEAATDILNTVGIKEESDEYKRLTAVLRDYMNTSSEARIQEHNLSVSKDNLKTQFTSLKEAIKASGVELKDWATGLTGITQGMMSFGMAISSFKSLKDTLSNPDISGWERFGAVLTSVSMIMMSMSGIYKGLASIKTVFKAITDKETLAKIANAAASVLQEKASRKVFRAKNVEEQETRENTAEINKETAAKVANNAADKIEFKGKNGKTRTFSGKMNKKGKYLDDNGQIISDKYVKKNGLDKFGKGAGKGAGEGAAKGAGKKLLNPGTLKTLGSFAAGAAIVAASVAIAAVAISKAVDKWHEHEKAAAEAAATAERLTEKYNQLKEAETAFRENINGYEEAVKGLDNLTKGTTEYKQAVMEANEKALELLKTNKDLSYTIDKESGLIQIDEDDLEAQEAASLKRQQRQQAAMLSANQNAKNKQLEADQVNFNRNQAQSGQHSWSEDDTTAAVGGGVAAGALAVGGGLLAAGAVNGWNPVGWVLLAAGAITAATAGIIVAVGDEVAAGEQEALDAIAEQREELGRDLTDTEIKEIALKYDDTGKLGESLAGTTEALNKTNEMAQAINENTAAVRANSEAILSQEYGAEKAEWLVDTYDEAYLTKKDELEKLNKSINKTEKYEEGYEAYDFLTEYQKLTGQTFDWDNSVAAKGDEDREFIYYEEGEDGEKVKKTMKAADMIEEMAVAYALEQQKQQAVLVGDMLTQIVKTQGTGTADALNEWTVNKSFGGNLSQNDFNQMQDNINSAGGTEAYLESLYGNNGERSLDEIAEELGYKSADAMVDSFNTAIADKKQDFEAAAGLVSENIKESFKSFTKDSLGQLGSDAQKEIASSMQKAYVTGGTTGYEMMERVLGNASNATELTELSAMLNSIDWSKATPSDLSNKIEELGIETDLTTSELQSLIDLMSTGVVKMTDIGKTYKTLTDSVKDLSLTQEEFTQMSELGLGSYFTQMYDGTYQLIGAAEDFEQVLRSIMQAQYATTLKSAKDRLTEIKNYQNETSERVAKLGYDSYEDAMNNISTTAVLDGYGGKISRNADGKVQSVEHIAEVSTYHDKGWTSPFTYSKEQVKQVITKAHDEVEDIGEGAMDIYNSRIDYIEAMGIVGEDMIESWRNSSDMAATEQEIINKYLPQAIEQHKKLESLDEIQQAAILQAEEALLSTAKDSEERKQLYESEGMNSQSYAKAVNAAIEQESWEGLNQEEVSEYAQYLEDGLGIAEEGAEEVARAVAKMNKGVETLSSNWEDWSSILKKSGKTSQEYAKAMQGTRNALSDILDVSEEFIDVSFVESAENLELIGKAAQGDAEAIDKLGEALAEDIALDAVTKQLDLGSVISIDGIDYVGDAAREKISSLMSEISGLLDGSNLSLGENLNTGDLFAKLNEVVTASKMTAEEANAFYRSMGFTPHFKMVDAVQAESVPLTKTYHTSSPVETGPDGEKSWVETEYSETIQVPGGELHSALPSMAMESGDGKMPQVPSTEIESVTYTGGGSLNNLSSTNNGGKDGGGTPKKTSDSRKKKSDVVDRYKEINDELEENNRLMEKNTTAAEGLWGSARIAKLKENVSLMKKENELLGKKAELAKQYLAEDKADLQKAAAEAGVAFTFNSDQNIDNYTDQMTALYNRREALLDSFEDTIEDDEQELLDDLDNKIDNLKTAYETYEGTLDEVKDLEQEQLEKQLAIQTENFNILNEELEVKLSINETDMARIDYYLNKIADDFYQMAEAAALMVGDLSKGVFGGQMGNYISNLEAQEKYMDDLETQFKNGDINQAQYIEGLQNSQGAIIDNLNSLNELDKTMSDYYGNTVAAAAEELSKFTALQEHSSSVLDHYSNIVSLMGKEQDYKYMQKILDAQVSVAKNSYDAAEEWYEVTQAQVKQKKEDYQKQYDLLSTDGNMSEEDWKALEWYEKQWLAAQETANEAEENMLSAHEAYLEKMKAATENALNDMNREYEKSMLQNMFGEDTKYTSFEQVNLAMERQSELQENILTSTNKKYEIDKLIRKTQQDIDKTINSIAKKELKAFIERSKAKGEQTELSKTELGILEQEYEVLKAKIALEEAQNAKSTVRLQRDSEGNFGYVYTADEDKVADAQQAYVDAENELYNQRLEAANEYDQKIVQTQAELTKTLNDLHSQFLNHEFESEQEYQDAVAAAYDHYYALLEDQQRIYNNIYSDEASWLTDFVSIKTSDMKTNVSTNSQLAHESWVGAFNLMTTNTETWKTNTDTYIKNVKDMLIDGENSYTKRVAQVATDAGLSLGNIADATGNIKTKSEELTKFITDPNTGLIKGLDDEMTKVGDLTEEYGLLKDKIGELITQYEKLLTGDDSITTRLKAAVDALMEDNPIDIPDIDFNINPQLGDDSAFWTAMESRYGLTANGNNAETPTKYNDYEYEGRDYTEPYQEKTTRALPQMIVYQPKSSNGAIGFSKETLEQLGAKSKSGYISTMQGVSKEVKANGGTWESNQPRSTSSNTIITVHGEDWILSGHDNLYYRLQDLTSYDTGGYTGEWGSYGKLAMVHEKELILNTKDTENFLASMELLDNIIKTIDLYSANAQWGGLLSTPTFGNYGSEPLEQNVHIEASFPGVTDKNQIEEAFNDIINLASQYANRKY